MIGRTVAHYRIVEKLGQGGMGEVYRANDTRLDRPVAIKFLRPDAIGRAERNQRFIREAKAASALNNPHIITIYDIGRHVIEGVERDFIVMETVRGKSLDEIIEGRPLPTDESLRYAVQIADALSAAHDAGIVHRDVKPSNIMITQEGTVKMLDFGLAKLVERKPRGASAATVTATLQTEEGVVLGTVAYMSPEQAQGKPVDVRSDVFSFGVVLYEMLTGRRPFHGDSFISTSMAILQDEPPPLKGVGGAVATELQRIVLRCLNKKKEARYRSATELLQDLEKSRNNLASSRRKWEVLLKRPRVAVPVMIIFLAAISTAAWFSSRRAKIRWAKQEALPEIERLIEASWRDSTDAYALAVQAEQYIPNDPKLVALLSRSCLRIDITTEPPGASIYMKEYEDPEGKWKFLGLSPIEDVRLPIGIFRWRFEKEGYETVLAAAPTWGVDITGKDVLVPNDLVRVLDKQDEIPAGMVRVHGEETPVGKLDDFFIDRFEVTNEQYKTFVDAGGYRNPEYWSYPFIKEGRVVTWEEAMSEFADQTGRPAPSTWRAGGYPGGQGDYPVAGVSWYEAAAYAAFADKNLPTGTHWGLARGEYTALIRWPQLGGFAVFAPFSNFGGKGPVAVGNLPGITSYGAYDMAGNVREWCWNETSEGRLLRGGAWDSNTYRFTELSQAPTFDRSSNIGFRCAVYPDPGKVPESVFGLIRFGESRKPYGEKPVSDAIFQVYREQFSYDDTPLNARLEMEDESAEDWTHQRVSYDAAYGKERIIGHLFLPKNAQPPYQTVVYFPGSASVFQPSSEDLIHYYEFPIFLSFLVKNGRAVLYPVYQGTFERRDDALVPIYVGADSHAYSTFLVQLVKDFKRSIDYLGTRPDIDAQKIAYYGMSWGGELGAIIPALEERIRTSIIVAGGMTWLGRPEARQINYVTRVTTPTLMLSGKYDTIFNYETSTKPMFDLLGTPDEDKKLKLYETDHIPPTNELIRETLAWLDQYLGPVER